MQGTSNTALSRVQAGYLVSNQAFGTWNGTATSANLVNALGVVPNTARAVNIYRTDWQGQQLLYPTARTNICSYSQAFTSGNWSAQNGATITTGSLDPNGGTSAASVAGPASPGILYAAASDFGYSYPAGTQIAFQSWLKIPSGNVVQVIIAGDGLPAGSNLITGTGAWQSVLLSVTADANGNYVNIAAFAQSSFTFDIAFVMLVRGALFTGSYIATNNNHVTVTDYTLNGTTVNLAQAPVSTATTNATFYAT